MRRIFDHEKLEVYRAALALMDWMEPVLQKFSKSLFLLVKRAAFCFDHARPEPLMIRRRHLAGRAWFSSGRARRWQTRSTKSLSI
jgi:hypothetical protein